MSTEKYKFGYISIQFTEHDAIKGYIRVDAESKQTLGPYLSGKLGGNMTVLFVSKTQLDWEPVTFFYSRYCHGHRSNQS